MLLKSCITCGKSAVTRHAISGQLFCASCFQENFIEEVHEYVQRYELIPEGCNVVIGVSGGKDSSALVDVLVKLLERHSDVYMDVHLHLVAVDEGIEGYRDCSLDTVRAISEFYRLPLRIESFKTLFRRSLDEIRTIYPSSTCSFCGILRRAALQLGAEELSLSNMRVATGHNADDNAETVFMNLMRGDAAKLERCVDPISSLSQSGARIKPFAYEAQRDIVLYAFHAHVQYFSTECPYAKDAFRGVARRLVSEFNGCEIMAQRAVLEGLRGGDSDRIRQAVKVQSCEQCNNIMSGAVCQVCLIRDAENADDFRRALKLK